MNITVKVTLAIPDQLVNALAQRLRAVGQEPADLFPNTIQSMASLADVGRAEWAKRAVALPGTEGRPLRLGTGPSDRMVFLNKSAYASSLRATPVQVMNDGVRVSILTPDPQAQVIEQGGLEIDLHAVLPYAEKAHESKAGKRYLRIPFRHATEETSEGGARFQAVSAKWGSNVLPSKVLAAMSDKGRYLRTLSYFERGPNKNTGMVERFLYTKPDSMKASELLAIGLMPHGVQGAPHIRNLIGLVKVGKSGHTHYLTVRTLSESNPEGWRIPAYEAQPIASETAQKVKEMVQQGWFTEAMRADVGLWLQRAAVPA